MNKPLFLCAALLGALLAACGGGGGASRAPAPSASAGSTTSHAALRITWMGAEHSKGGVSGAASLRHALDALASSEPVAMGAVEPLTCSSSCTTVGPNGSVGTVADSATVMVQEVNAAGSPVPVASPQITTPSIVTPGSQSAGAADAVQIPVSANSASTGDGTITVNTADGLTTSIPVQVLPNLAIGIATNPETNVDAAVGVQFGSNGAPVAVTDTAQADVYAALATGSAPSEFVFPYGFAFLPAGVGISDEAGPPVGFESQGTTLTFNDLVTNLGTESFLVFATASGHYVYWTLTAGSGLGAAPNYATAIAEFGSFKYF